MRLATLCFLVKEDEILLAMKKRGFGVDKWNGVGGKVHENETIEEAAARETHEEIGVITNPKHLENCGNIKFYFNNKPDFDMHVHVFFAKNWQGEPVESEEMKPKWYKFTEIPYDQMWIDDTYWLPKVLNDRKIKAEFYFNKNATKIEGHKIKEI